MSHEPEPDAEPEVLDLAHLRDVCSDDVDFEREIIGDFMDQIGPMFERLAGAVAAGEPSAIRFAAHAIKGSSRSLGAVALAEACGRLEAIEDAEGVADAGRLLDRAAVEVDRLRDRIQRHLEGRAA